MRLGCLIHTRLAVAVTYDVAARAVTAVAKALPAVAAALPKAVKSGVPAAMLALSACADYQFTVNERIVYTPAPPYRDFDIPDDALRACLQQTIADGSITAAEQLTELNCSHAGVAGLDGLQTFPRLVRLKLSSNVIEDLSPLADMSALRELYLDGNRLRDLAPLRGLPELEYLDLRANERLACPQLDFFRSQPRLQMEPPRHCQARQGGD
jgi:Leucine-rich repeat (LRR) protein